MINYQYSDCHLAEIMEDPEDVSSPGMRRPMCSFCGKKWPEIIKAPQVLTEDIELRLRRWKEGDMSTRDLTNFLVSVQEAIWRRVADRVRPHLQGKKKPLYTLDALSMSWKLTKETK